MSLCKSVMADKKIIFLKLLYIRRVEVVSILNRAKCTWVCRSRQSEAVYDLNASATAMAVCNCRVVVCDVTCPKSNIGVKGALTGGQRSNWTIDVLCAYKRA